MWGLALMPSVWRERERSRTTNQTHQAMAEEEGEEVDREGETRKGREEEELSSVIR